MPKSIVRKTVKGQNFLGRVLNKVLPFPKVREAIGSAITGTKRGLPIPELNDADIEEAAESALKKLKSEKPEGLKRDELLEVIYTVRDILDNGKIDDSVSELSPGVKKVIEKAFSAVPIVAYIIYGITTGDFSLAELIAIFGAGA